MTNSLVALAPKPIHYTINQSELAAAKIAQNAILGSMPNNIIDLDIESVKTEKRKVVKFRTTIEKERKEYKAGALEYGKLVDSLAEEAQQPVTEIENVYDKIIKEYDEHFERLAKEAAEKEEKRVAAIKEKMQYYLDSGIGDGFSSGELQSELEHLQAYITDSFDFQEFSSEMKSNFTAKESYVKNRLVDRLKYEAEQVELKKQQTAQAEAQAKFEAEKAAFVAEQKAVQDKIDAERDALQKRIFAQEYAEQEQLRKIEDAQRTERQAKELVEREEWERIRKEEWAEQKRLEDEKRAKEKEELARQHLQIVADREAREKAQAAEDRVRNAAPQMLEVLEYVLNSDVAMREEDEGVVSPTFTKIRNVIKLAKGE